jgi:hypothetical protein
MNAIALILLGLSIICVALISIYQQRIIERLRADLRTERENQLSKMQETRDALQLVLKYQNYLKEKGIPLP